MNELIDRQLAKRIWQKDTTAFAPVTAPPALHQAIEQRLGWLDAPAGMRDAIPEILSLVTDLRRDHITDVYLLGMGGSSLCAEVLRDVPLARADPLKLVVLDTTDERAIRTVTDSLVPQHSAFIVASKSGSTIEVASLEQHFWSVMTDDGKRPGAHFIAITDPDTSLGDLADQRGYRRTFINPPDIGGRYSALSLFGLVPAALTGLALPALLDSADQIAERCRADETWNPGLSLGVFMAAHAAAGRDKLTILLPPSLMPLGPWIEQLVAESTGKMGKGVLPIVGEPIGKPSDYGADRAFVAVLARDGADVRAAAQKLEAAGHPVLRIETAVGDLGGEFFRWEFATAVAGVALGINPFDEPNVKDAKVRTKAQLDFRHEKGVFRMDPPLERGPGYSRRESRSSEARDPGGRFLAILDYLPTDPNREAVVSRLRESIRRRTGVASTHGVGPRYLHSTGQYHKGGPNTGLFLLLTAADTGGTPIPGVEYTFSTLKQAQALGDFDALVAAGREVIHYHIDDATADFTAELQKVAGGWT